MSTYDSLLIDPSSRTSELQGVLRVRGRDTFSQNTWAALAPGFSSGLFSIKEQLYGLFSHLPLSSVPWHHLCSPEVRGELYPIHGLKSLIPNNLITWKLIVQVSSRLNEFFFQLQDELSGEDGWESPKRSKIWD